MNFPKSEWVWTVPTVLKTLTKFKNERESKMSFETIRQIPSPAEIAQIVPIPESLKSLKAQRDSEIRDILTGKVSKFLAIIGPCSADDENAVCEYTKRLAKVQEEIKDKVYIIPRIYTNKPRTTGEGYKGMLHQPNPVEEPNMLDGILSIRRLHVRIMEEAGFTSADEMLYPDNLIYVEDLLSYIAIGARSSENQQHRLTSSGIDVPVGMKNPMSGDLSVMYNSIYAAQHPHTFIYQREEVQTSGNPLAHGILRGSVNRHGENIPNYHYEDLLLATQLYREKNLENPFIVVDTNHSNSKKQHLEQSRIVKDILYSRNHNKEIFDTVKGLLIESYLVDGAQGINDGIYGKSITDPCIGIEKTEELLYYLAENV